MNHSSAAQAIDQNDTTDDDSNTNGQGGPQLQNSSSSQSRKQENSASEKPLDELTLIFHHGRHWIYQLFKLASAELSMTVESYILGVALKIASVVIYFTLYIALCCLLSTWVAKLVQSIYAGFATFIACQIVVIVVLKLTISKLKSMRGFSQTKAQFAKLKEKTQVENQENE